MRFRIKGAARTALTVLIAAASFGAGVMCERMSNERFVVETISYTDETAEPVESEQPEQTAAAEGAEPTAANEEVIDGKVNINTADAALLDELDGIGPSTAQKIIDYREKNGPFESVEELVLVSGIGEKKLDAIRDMICVE